MEPARRGEAAPAVVEAPAGVDPEWEGWVAPEQAQALKENAFVQNVERLSRMKSEHPVPLCNAPIAVHQW